MVSRPWGAISHSTFDSGDIVEVKVEVKKFGLESGARDFNCVVTAKCMEVVLIPIMY